MEARKWTLKQKIQGMPKVEDFVMVTETLDTSLKDGEILTKAEWLAVDPFMRLRANELPIGEIIPGSQVARVLKSRHPDFPEGSKVVGLFGWGDVTKFNAGIDAEQRSAIMHQMPDLRGLPDSYALGVCGVPGNMAYFGVTKILQPKEGETLVVSAAAGGVGSVAGQIGKMLGCTVVGFTGSDEKVSWLKKLGFDQAYNYKSGNVSETYQENVTQGIDCCFDNVGGEFTYHTLQNMNNAGRIAVCGAISTYNEDASQPYLVPFNYATLIYKNIKMEGFWAIRFVNEWFDGINQLRDWVIEGKISVQETVSEGFESIPQALIDVFNGRNTGRQIVKL